MWRRLQFPCPSGPASAPPKPEPKSPIVMEKVCACGDITVRIYGEDLSDGVARGHVCFCGLCRLSTGSHYAHSVEIPLGQGKLGIEGTPESRLSTHLAPGLSPGSISRRHFCARCGTIIGGTAGHAPRIFMVRVGGFEHVPPPKNMFLASQMVDWLRDKITDVPDGDDMEKWRVVTSHLHPERDDTVLLKQDEKQDALNPI